MHFILRGSTFFFLFLFAGNLSAQTFQKRMLEGVSSKHERSALATEGGVPVIVTASSDVHGTGVGYDTIISTSSVTGRGIISAGFDLVYDETVVQYNGCSVAGTMAQNLTPTCNLTGPGVGGAGKVTIILFGAIPLADTTPGVGGELLKINFTVVGGTGGSTPLTFQNFEFNEGDPPNTTVPGSLVVLAPTAAQVVVSGRVVTNSGRGLAKTVVTITDGSGFVRSGFSNSFGYFQIFDVPAGSTYFISARAKGYTFASELLPVEDQITGLILTAEQ
ncbi:MAG: hypothetical protein DMF62_12115 [Acidobacteria bacterium]|nr:MAG: hypothetical protein DMF62_12115 [Acidobacteriota bacterium]